MRVSEDRYARDLRRLNLAQRLIRHEVRTYWICTWTGLTKNRVRNLYRSYDKTLGDVLRHRGPSPTRIATYTRSTLLRIEASAIGGLARAFGLRRAKAGDTAHRDRQGVEFAERLCRVYELFQQIVPESHFTMDQFIRLAIELTDGQELQIGHCENCHGALLLDRQGASRRLCPTCKQDLLKASSTPQSRRPDEAGALSDAADPSQAVQQPLF